ncbi:hypothetical protein PAF17_18655 [Paracoccus sp. Z330]|uniref:Tripartite tricarboxylate transporter TctB family protein n=1 Tax=Paracoccus onchidii TaxID=3017813 RepID=A0ABT4ZJG4_9RHOB|nr:hypothetical protein [Paracoccus onchidii]MDB6179503.1 hypothetical protein [Paracoccus onchidii]
MKQLVNSDTLLGGFFGLVALILLRSSYHSSDVFLLPGDAPPFLVAQLALYAVLALSLAILIKGVLRGGVAPGDIRWRPTFLMMALLLMTTVLFKMAGYLLIVPLAVAGCCLILGYRKPVPLVGLSVAVPVATYLLLVKFASLPLPTIPGLEF